MGSTAGFNRRLLTVEVCSAEIRLQDVCQSVVPHHSREHYGFRGLLLELEALNRVAGVLNNCNVRAARSQVFQKGAANCLVSSGVAESLWFLLIGVGTAFWAWSAGFRGFGTSECRMVPLGLALG